MWFQKPPVGTPLDWGNPLNDETTLHLAMNEGNGDKVQDLSLNGNHGTLNNFTFPPTVASGWNPGQTGIGLKLDGTNDHINCGNNPVLNINGKLTISAIVRLDTINVSNFIVGASGGNKGYSLRTSFVDSGDLNLYIGDGAAYHQFTYAHGMVVNNWYAVCATYDGNAGRIYINGSEIGSTVDVFTPSGISGLNLMVGADSAGTSNSDGEIDQARIQTRAWSAKEVRDYAINPWQVYLDE